MKLPVVSARELVKLLFKKGYYLRGQKGSHLHLRHPNLPPLTIPNHGTLAKGTRLEIMKIAGLTRDDFV